MTTNTRHGWLGDLRPITSLLGSVIASRGSEWTEGTCGRVFLGRAGVRAWPAVFSEQWLRL